jgi:hypothetical protein
MTLATVEASMEACGWELLSRGVDEAPEVVGKAPEIVIWPELVVAAGVLPLPPPPQAAWSNRMARGPRMRAPRPANPVGFRDAGEKRKRRPENRRFLDIKFLSRWVHREKFVLCCWGNIVCCCGKITE